MSSKPIVIAPRQRSDSTDSEQLSVSSPRERQFSFSEVLGARTSINEAYKKYNSFTINGDGFHRERYLNKLEAPVECSHHLQHHQEYFLP